MNAQDHGHEGDGRDHASGGRSDHDHATKVTEDSQKRVFWVMLLTGTYMIAQAVGGFLSGSLALIADAGHMLSDTGALALAFVAFRLSRRPADARRTYGYGRFQILAAFINGLTLFVIAVWITYEAVERFRDPVEVLAGPMLVVAVIGLAVNVVGFVILRRGDSENVNMRGALLHVLGDLLGSVAAIVAALVILATGWTPIDPLLSVFVTILILRSAWNLTRRSANILMEGAPEEFDSDAIAAEAAAVDGVVDVHHVHVWSITGERRMASLHVRLSADADPTVVKAAVRERLATGLNIGHVTIEVDDAGCPEKACAAA